MRHHEAQAAEVRKHYYLDQYVVIAPKRTHSLHHADFPKAGPLKEPPLEDETSIFEISGPKHWAVKVIRNLYPAFSMGNKQAYGVQEVILEANPADVKFARLSVEQIQRVFDAYRQRIEAVAKIKDITYISIFHNDGLEAGASIKQTHSQMIAVGVAPPKLTAEATVFSQLKKRHGVSPLTRAINWEEQEDRRIIYSDKYLAALAPYASEYPFEVWLVPKRQVKSITELKGIELEALAKTLKAVIMTLDSEQISYNFHLVEAIKGHDNHFMVKVTPRSNVWAGFELNTGIPINPVSPEDAAHWYRTFTSAHNAL